MSELQAINEIRMDDHHPGYISGRIWSNRDDVQTPRILAPIPSPRRRALLSGLLAPLRHMLYVAIRVQKEE
jgi:hypothetical protein